MPANHATASPPKKKEVKIAEPAKQAEPAKLEKVALIVGCYGFGEKVAMKLAKTMDIALTYISDEGWEDTKKVSYGIRAQHEIPRHRKVQEYRFHPKYSNAATTLMEKVVHGLKAPDVVVFASMYSGISDKTEVFDAEVSAFYAIYQAALKVCKGHFRIIHVSNKVPSTITYGDVALEALIRAFGEELRVTPDHKKATVNAIKVDPKSVPDDDVVGMVATLAARSSWFINGQIIRRIPI